MKVNSRIELEFAGINLPIGKDAEGRDIVPLKPISDVFGLSWSDVKKKIGAINSTCGGDNPPAGTENPEGFSTCIPDNRDAGFYLRRRLGVCIEGMYHAGQLREMICIRLDRVAAYLNQIEPERVRGGGNEIGADFLEAKQCEWDDLLHEYESRQGGMLAGMSDEARSKAIYVRLYLSTLRAKQGTTDERDRKALSALAETLAADAGAPYQPDLT